MIYRIVHRTTYKYKYPVSVGNHVACLKPRSLLHHELVRSELHIQPPPATRTERVDYFGNRLCFFTVQEPHKELVVEARSEVIVDGSATPWPQQSLPWEEAAISLPNDQSPEGLEAYQFGFESPRIRTRPEFASYALQSFTPGRPMAEALLDLTARIHVDFRFDSKVTDVRTPTEEVFQKRRGVCQDFAHLQIACLRSLNLAARYISGYLRTYPPPGKPRLKGADASHAWVSAYCPDIGWLDMDPTNNVVPSDGHVTLAWGRDYSDVSPLRGLILGGGAHTLKVAVDMEPLES
ncbi:transglutaminase family protein [Edaphobacter modestus]|uniref:Transglutaminase-like putative cysteine protease n=1 Tax=Edaphobacter modestus TaxID=388466 RepID=A0A4Q7YW41_9BACT|nr:transglutaminase family protein [Edaphobacter modestus]RZU41900.1 transglutaminase-like putative cysteine protease [Edaphobacter modestus]